MAQRINPNILKLNISKGVYNNSYYKNLSKNKNLNTKYHEDLFLHKFIEGFYFIFNFYTSEIIINRQQTLISCNLLLHLSSNLFPLSKNRIFWNYLPQFWSENTSQLMLNKNYYTQFLKLNSLKEFNSGLLQKNKFSTLNLSGQNLQILKYSTYYSKFNTIDYLYWNEIK